MAGLAIPLIAAALALDGCRKREPAPRERLTLSYFRLGWSQPDEGTAVLRLAEDFARQTGIGITHPPVPETSLSQLDLSRKLIREPDTTVDVLGVDVVWSGVLLLLVSTSTAIPASDSALMTVPVMDGLRVVELPGEIGSANTTEVKTAGALAWA